MLQLRDLLFQFLLWVGNRQEKSGSSQSSAIVQQLYLPVEPRGFLCVFVFVFFTISSRRKSELTWLEMGTLKHYKSGSDPHGVLSEIYSWHTWLLAVTIYYQCI